ncbi:MAG: hypothetical protein COS89_05295 [Deltaproteobacteria bacterium CG07_land_8_20_14_0_80_38_7]|nr:MAG: hypothetical protein COS89_05295 [Deltaproteobacteria bacterium CG07_land_8_20_14_0_80_38_7]
MINKINFEKLSYLLLPVFLILGGVRTIINSEFKMWSNTLAVGVQAQLGGLLVIIIGLVFLIIILKDIFKRT